MKAIDLDLRILVGHCCFYLFGNRPFYYIGYMEGWYFVKPFSPGPTSTKIMIDNNWFFDLFVSIYQ